MLLTMQCGSLVLVLSAASFAQTARGLSGMATLDRQSKPTQNAIQQTATQSAVVVYLDKLQ